MSRSVQTSNDRPQPPSFVLSRYLSLAAMFAFGLARHRKHEHIEVQDFLAACYIADPHRFLCFWENPFACIGGLELDCGLVDPPWVLQLQLKEIVQSELNVRATGISYKYSDDLANTFLKIAHANTKGQKAYQIGFAEFLLAVRQNSQISTIFRGGFRSSLAKKEAEREAREANRT